MTDIQPSRPEAAPRVQSYQEIERQVAEFEAAERRRLGLEAPPDQWHDPNPSTFTAAQRSDTTILAGGLTVAQDRFVQAALEGLGYRIEVLDCPDVEALHVGKEFGNRGQCNPTYFTVGNLLKKLIHLRDVEGLPVEEIVQRYLFMTAGACGPCRFGTYVTEYRKALRDAGFEGFRVLLFQQTGGLKQATGRRCRPRNEPAFLPAAGEGSSGRRRAERDRLPPAPLRDRGGRHRPGARALAGHRLRCPAAPTLGGARPACLPLPPGARRGRQAATQAEGDGHR